MTWQAIKDWGRGDRPMTASAQFAAAKSANNRSVLVRDRRTGDVSYTYSAPAGLEVGDVFLDGSELVVVNSDPQEESSDRPVVVDLISGTRRELASDAPKAWMGGWALGNGALTYGARGPKNSYCLAQVELETLNGGIVECVAPRHGIHQAELSPSGLAYTTFDDTRPASCNTARVRSPGKPPTDLAGPTKCRVWQTVMLPNGGAIWAEVPDPEEIEVAEVWVRAEGEDPVSLGYGTTGSLAWCGEFVWFVRQTQGQLMRWSQGRGLELAFELGDSASGVAVLSAPSCGGDAVSVTELGEASGAGTREILHTARLR